MINAQHKEPQLFSRSEGKIKSYESCSDIRAWSHDVRHRDLYLRGWMKSNMPIYFIPASTLSYFLRTMTCRSRRRATPRCHPDCKSKMVLESICASCHAVKECLQQDRNLEKYFIEEDIESSHWPCDRCLEALKSIKMFWKIIVEKIFKLNLSTFGRFDAESESTNSAKSVTKVWQSEIVHQAFYLKSVTPSLHIIDNSEPSYTKIPPSNGHSKVCKSTSVTVITNNIGCQTCSTDHENNESDLSYKNNLNALQLLCNEQTEEMEKLRRENHALRIDLIKVKRKRPSVHSFDDAKSNPSLINYLPQPFEDSIEDIATPKSIDSEMIITMKNTKNKSYRRVSMLQVLHKTNQLIAEDMDEYLPNSRKEDPINILNKVQHHIGAMVKREINIVNDRKSFPKKTEVDASFQKVNIRTAHPSKSTLSSQPSSYLGQVSFGSALTD